MSEWILSTCIWLGLLLILLERLPSAIYKERCHLSFMQDIEDFLLSPGAITGYSPFLETNEGYLWSRKACRERSFRHP